MVVLDRLAGVKCYVQVNGVTVQEYDDDEDVETQPGPVGEYQALRTVTKYIEAVTGAEFSIACHFSSQFKMDSPNLELRMYVDGIYTQGRVIGPHDLGSYFNLEGPIIFHPSSKGSAQRFTTQKYKFSKLDISNDEARLSELKKNTAEAEKVGIIEIKIWRVSDSTPIAPSPASKQQTSSNKFHEKALKGQAKSHNVSYSAETTIPPESFVSVQKLDGEDYPIAIFKLKYRSKEALKQLLIIERTPEPEDSPTPGPEPDVNLETLTAAQRERLKAFLRSEGIAPGRASNTPDRKVKRERDNGESSSNQRPRKKSKTSQVVDLTGDSDDDE